MRTRLRAGIAGGVLLAAAAVGGVAAWLLAAGGGGGSPVAQPAGAQQKGWTIDEARNFSEFPLYWLGETYKGLTLDGIYRVKWYPEPGSLGFPQDSVTFIYSDATPCAWPTPDPDGNPIEWGCPVDLSVSVERGCLVPPGVVQPFTSGAVTPKIVRGALVMELGSDHVRAWSGDVAINVFVSAGRQRDLGSALDVFMDLVPLDAPVERAGGPLPAGPDPGAIQPLDSTAVFNNKGGC